MKLFDLTGRLAVIAGRSRGIGKKLAHGFAEAGAKVYAPWPLSEANQELE